MLVLLTFDSHLERAASRVARGIGDGGSYSCSSNRELRARSWTTGDLMSSRIVGGCWICPRNSGIAFATGRVLLDVSGTVDDRILRV